MNRTVFLLLVTIGLFAFFPNKVDIDFELQKRDVIIVSGVLTATSLVRTNTTRRRY
ncbi:hypothetical protein Riv7116_6915 (plasmid) [Rivularia sp. PCC 7116]|nr:hypothetical protein Riv7116_6915 [Rivularia sp. PCC 7116]